MKRLQKWMLKNNLSGTVVASIFEVSPNTVYRWRSGNLKVPKYVFAYIDLYNEFKHLEETFANWKRQQKEN